MYQSDIFIKHLMGMLHSSTPFLLVFRTSHEVRIFVFGVPNAKNLGPVW